MDRRSSYSKVSSGHSKSASYDNRHSSSSASKEHYDRRSEWKKETPITPRSLGRSNRYEVGDNKRKYSEPSVDYRHSSGKNEPYGASASNRYRDSEPNYKRPRVHSEAYEGRGHSHHSQVRPAQYESRYHETPPSRSHSQRAPAPFKKPVYTEAEPRKPRPLLPPDEERRILKAKAYPVRPRGGGGGRRAVTGKPRPIPPRRPRRDDQREPSDALERVRGPEKEENDELGEYEGDENQDLDEEDQKEEKTEVEDAKAEGDAKTEEEEATETKKDTKNDIKEDAEEEMDKNEEKTVEETKESNGIQEEEHAEVLVDKRSKDEDLEAKEVRKKRENKSSVDLPPSKGSKTDRDDQRAGSKDKSDYIRLQCPHCHLRCLTFSTYVNHLSSQRHLDALQKLSQQHRQSLATLRSRQRREQAQMEAQNVKPVRQEQMNFCAICKLYHSESRPNHEATELHKIIKNFLMPFCPICRIAFKSRMLYEKHVATLMHVKAKANMEKMYERRREQARGARDRGEEHEDVDELDPANMLTLDAVGSVDDCVGLENGEEPLTGEEYVKKLTVLYCEACKRYLARTEPLDKALALHCKSALHLKEAEKKQDEEKNNAMREEEERCEATSAEEQGEKAKTGQEDEVKKEEDQEEKLWEEGGPEFTDGEETNDGEKQPELEESQDGWDNKRVVKEREEEQNGEQEEREEENEKTDDEQEGQVKMEEEEDHVLVMEHEGEEGTDGL